MKNRLLITTLTTLSFSTLLYAEESKTVSFDNLPKAVQASALKHLMQSSITKVEAIEDDGITQYEIESMNDGVSKDITFAGNGFVLEIEQGMAFSQLPAAAQQAVKKEYPAIKITEVESVQEFYFDVEGEVDGKPLEFKVLASGDIEDD